MLSRVVIAWEAEHPAPFSCLPRQPSGVCLQWQSWPPYPSSLFSGTCKGVWACILWFQQQPPDLLLQPPVELCALVGVVSGDSLEPVPPVLLLILPAHCYLQEIFCLKILGLFSISYPELWPHSPPAMLEFLFFFGINGLLFVSLIGGKLYISAVLIFIIHIYVCLLY